MLVPPKNSQNGVSMLKRISSCFILVALLIGLTLPDSASDHNVSKRDASFVQSSKGAAIAPFVYLGAKHMVTGYDHLAFWLASFSFYTD
jgi:hypothetical protein